MVLGGIAGISLLGAVSASEYHACHRAGADKGDSHPKGHRRHAEIHPDPVFDRGGCHLREGGSSVSCWAISDSCGEKLILDIVCSRASP
jgi:hypothetical protein